MYLYLTTKWSKLSCNIVGHTKAAVFNRHSLYEILNTQFNRIKEKDSMKHEQIRLLESKLC